MKYWICSVFFPLLANAQVVNTGMTANYDSLETGKIKIGGFVDTYYGFDFNKPAMSDRPYCVSSSRHNEINVNLAYIELQYANERVRGRLVPGFGTYINANYANEKGSLKNLMEANVGIQLSKKHDIWLDAGIFGAPYTNETAISKDHLMYTRSIAPEYAPYYLAGAKLSAPIGSKWKTYAYIINGWQVINDVNNPLAIGTQVEFRPNNNVLINWDTYIGDERSVTTPDYRQRYFSDIYLIFNNGKRFSLTSCVYGGIQAKKDTVGTSHSSWWQANLIGEWKFSPTIALAGRVEYYSDPSAIMITPVTGVQGFDCGSAGVCLNVRITNHAMLRLEGRHFFSGREIFYNTSNESVAWSDLLMTNLTVWF